VSDWHDRPLAAAPSPEREGIDAVEIYVWDVLNRKLDTLSRQNEAAISLLSDLSMKVGAIMATQQELAGQVKAIGDKLAKIGEETKTLLKTVDDLKTALDAAGAVTPELQAAVDAVATQAGVIDDLVPDQPVP
jgi:chromosome segregation ATPase